MSAVMKEDRLKALVAKLAKDIKTEKDLGAVHRGLSDAAFGLNPTYDATLTKRGSDSGCVRQSFAIDHYPLG